MKPFPALLVTLAALTLQVFGSGFFELQIQEVRNPGGKRLDGSCCGKVSGSPTNCPQPCRTSVKLCLKPRQTTTGPCPYGSTSSAVIGGNSFLTSTLLKVPFTFSWPGNVSLAFDVFDNVIGQPRKLIASHTHSNMLNPPSPWHPISHQDVVAYLSYRYRVRCDTNYYGSKCDNLCIPRDDLFGHYTCDQNGNKQCLPGWVGQHCDTAQCTTGCHPQNGYCNRPGVCNCKSGWQGPLCDTCVPHPNCVHGSCNTPFQCKCYPRWGGIHCNLDLDPCDRQKPCTSGTTCKNTGPGKYTCNTG